MRETRLPSPWFLVPETGELSENEADELFACIRSRLLDAVARTSRIIHTIGRLSPDESLPLLYAMRHVAREYGRTAYYWPAFHREILDRQIQLRDVQVRLAPVLARAWLRLYEYTHGALYYPREGRRYIKWPLAHAGLLQDDEELLKEFGKSLISEYGSSPSNSPLQPDDLEEFLLLMLDWLTRTRQYADKRLATIVSKGDGTDLTIGELAQQWMSNHWHEIVERKPRSDVYRVKLPRCYLRYDAARHRITLALSESIWRNSAQVIFQCGHQRVPLASRFRESDNMTECMASEVPVLSSAWEDKAMLIVGEQTYTLRLPKISETRSIVFKAGNGRAIRHWNLGEEYYVLLPIKRLREDAANVLFEEWVMLGSPEGQWSEHTILWVRTGQPFQTSSDNGKHRDVADVISRLEEATDALGLPSFGHLWQPRLYLIGGVHVSDSDEEQECFATNDAPWLEVGGFWEDSLNISLAKWDMKEGRFLALDSLELKERQATPNEIIEIWHDGVEPTEGLYCLEIGSGAKQSFQLLEPTTSLDLSKLNISLEIEGQEKSKQASGLTRRDLEYGELVVNAWPMAQLILQASCGVWARSITIHMDDEGSWHMRWRDIGIGGIPDGAVTLAVSWRGIAKTQLTFANTPFIDEDSIELRWIDQDCGEILQIRANVSNKGHNQWATIVLLGSCPWDGQIQTQTARVNEKGLLRAQIWPLIKEYHWLLIMPSIIVAKSSSIPQLWAVKSLIGNSIRQYRLAIEYFDGECWETWRNLADQLRGFILPPDLRDVVDLSNIGSLLNDHDLLSLQPVWSIGKGSNVIERLREWSAFGFDPTIILFSTKFHTLCHSIEMPSFFLKPSSLNHFVSAIQKNGGEVPLVCVKRDSSLENLTSSLIVQREKDRWCFEIQTNEWIYACSNCGIVLHSRVFSRHSCTSLSFTSYGPGKKLAVQPSILWNPEVVIQCIMKLLLGLVSDNCPPVPKHAEHWLDQLDGLCSQQHEQSPEHWLIGLVRTFQRFWEFIGKGTESRSKLVDFGRLVDQYMEGLDIICQWIVSEMNIGNADSG